jgi:hypothetical protein
MCNALESDTSVIVDMIPAILESHNYPREAPSRPLLARHHTYVKLSEKHNLGPQL